jgi:hypothetical protein
MTAATETFLAGIYPDMPEDEYHADPVPGGSLSVSGAKKLLPPHCPARFRYEQDHPVYKQVFDFGSAAHKLVLGAGPELVVVDSDAWRTNAAKAAREEARAAGKSPVLTHEHEQIKAMATAIRAHPLAGRLLDPGDGAAELSLFWVDAEYPVWRRARLDWLRRGTATRRALVVDYKSGDSADPAAFAKSAANLGYHQQAAFYLDGVAALDLAEDPAFLFVVQEKNPPFLVTTAQFDDEAIRVGRELNRRAIEMFRDCCEADVWPAYSQDVELISLPPWAARREDVAW